MRFLRALLNSGVFMIILLAAATLYLVYSDAIKRDHGMDVVNDASSPVAEASTAVLSPAVQEAAPVQQASVAVESVPTTAQEPIQSEPAFETQPPAQAQSDMSAMMPHQGMMPMPMQEQMPPMMAYQPQMDMPPMQPMPQMDMPPMQPMPQMDMPPMQPMPQMDMPSMQPMPQMDMPSMQPMPQMNMSPMQSMPQMDMPPMQQMPQSNVEKARAALHEGNLEVAQQAYQSELAVSNDPDLHGELGNVFFAQQNWQAASIEYAAAIEGLTAQGRFLQAQYVLGFLMQIDPSMGQKAMTNLRAQMYPQNN